MSACQQPIQRGRAIGPGVPVVLRNRIKANVACGRVRKIVIVKQQRLTDQPLQRIVLRPAHRRTQRAVAQAVDARAEFQQETAPGAFIALHGTGQKRGGKRPHQLLQHLARERRGFINDQPVAGSERAILKRSQQRVWCHEDKFLARVYGDNVRRGARRRGYQRSARQRANKHAGEGRFAATARGGDCRHAISGG